MAGAEMELPAGSVLCRSGTQELLEAAVLPAPGRYLLVVLAGYGHGLRSHFSLAEPRELEVFVRLREGRREYLADALDLRTLPTHAPVLIDPSDAQVWRFDTPSHDAFRVFLVCRQPDLARIFEDQMTHLAFEAATRASDWRLENVIEWCAAERRARAGWQPATGVELPSSLHWRLRRPVFRADSASTLLYEWELAPLAPGSLPERQPLTCVTGADGEITRSSDLALFRVLWGRSGSAEQRTSSPVPRAPVIPGPLPVEVAVRPAAPVQPREVSILDATRAQRDAATKRKVRELFARE